MKNILVPVDFSRNSIQSAEYAAMLARKTGSAVHLLNIIAKPDFLPSGGPMFYTMPAVSLINNSHNKSEDAAKKNLDKLRHRNLFKGLDVSCRVRESGIVHDEIILHSRVIKADLIVIGSKGASGLKNILLGSTAERVVRFSEKPVLVIPEKPKRQKRGPIVFASDFLEEAYGIFLFVRSFAKILGADIHLLKINTVEQFNSSRDNLKIMDDFNRYFKTKYNCIIYDDFMKEEGIIHYSNDVDAELIALGTHGKKGLMRFFRSDISGGMVRLSQKPILVVNIKKYKSKFDLK